MPFLFLGGASEVEHNYCHIKTRQDWPGSVKFEYILQTQGTWAQPGPTYKCFRARMENFNNSHMSSPPEPQTSEDTTNFLAPVNHVSDVKFNDGGSNTVTVMHSRGEQGVTKTRTVRIDSNGVAADIVVIKKG